MILMLSRILTTTHDISLHPCVNVTLHFLHINGKNNHAFAFISMHETRHRYETHCKFKMMLEHIKVNQSTMRTNIDSKQGKMDRLLETMLSLAQKERNVEIDVEARRIVA